MLLETLRSLRAYRPGIAYILSNTLYLSPTARSPAGRTMRSLRGPIFEDPADGSFATLDPTRFSSAPLPKSRESQQASTAEHTGFQPLGEGEAEPTASELASLVEEFFSAVGDGATRDRAASSEPVPRRRPPRARHTQVRPPNARQLRQQTR